MRVVAAVKETLMDPRVLRGIEEYLDLLKGEIPQRRLIELDELRSRIEANSRAKENILRAIERATSGGSLEALMDRLDKLERSNNQLHEQIEELEEMELRRVETRTTADNVVRFIEQFEEVFQAAPVEEKKLLLRRCVSEILIDRKRGVARIAVRRIPALTEEIERLYEKREAPTIGVVGQSMFGVEPKPQKTTPTTPVVGVSSSGDRLSVSLTTLVHVVELELRDLWTRG